MASLSPKLPDEKILILGLTAVFNVNGHAHDRLAILHREPSIYSSTFPSEIVTCRFEGKGELRLLFKYARRKFYTGHGHRGGVLYEAEVYRRVLQPSQASTPFFYGTYTDSKTRTTWLILEYLDNTERVSKPRGGMARAARWIGRFHALQEAHLAGNPVTWLTTYDAQYYRGWPRRTLLFGRPMRQRLPWLATLCERFDEVIPLLLASPATIIHGEYYPHNILSQGRVIRPVDWESAAIGAGEIDLASLTEGWPAATVRRCEEEYRRARWPDGAPASFNRTLDAARLYMGLRWLGDERESTAGLDLREYFHFVRSLGKRLGLI